MRVRQLTPAALEPFCGWRRPLIARTQGTAGKCRTLRKPSWLSLPSTSAMQRDGVRAYWIEKDLPFDAALLSRGTNVIKLLSHANSWSQGVMYDCVRLELDPSRPLNAAAP